MILIISKRKIQSDIARNYFISWTIFFLLVEIDYYFAGISDHINDMYAT
jgi:hypothetical protein